MNQKMCETLRSLRKNCGYTMPQVEKLLAQAGCPAGKSSVSRWETGYTGPTAEQFLALCRIYHVRDVVETFSEGKTISYQAGLNELGYKKLEEYRQLLIASGLYKPVDNVIPYPERTSTRRIAHYRQPASAGYGVFLDSEEYQEVEVGADVPLSATYGVSLHGDSMEPAYHDGDSVWIHQQRVLEDGEIGLFMLDGQSYVKKLGHDKRGVCLISLNPAYPPMRVDDGNSFRVFGKVVATTPKPTGME